MLGNQAIIALIAEMKAKARERPNDELTIEMATIVLESILPMIEKRPAQPLGRSQTAI